MATSRPRSVPASKFRVGVALVGVIDGVNTLFFTPDFFRQVPSNFQIAVLYNGHRLEEGVGNDFTVAESGGVGTGFDTVTTLFTPKPGDKLIADYVVV